MGLNKIFKKLVCRFREIKIKAMIPIIRPIILDTDVHKVMK